MIYRRWSGNFGCRNSKKTFSRKLSCFLCLGKIYWNWWFDFKVKTTFEFIQILKDQRMISPPTVNFSHGVQINRVKLSLFEDNKSKSVVFHSPFQFGKLNLLFMRHMCDEEWNERGEKIFLKFLCLLFNPITHEKLSLHFLYIVLDWIYSAFCHLRHKRFQFSNAGVR